MSISVRFFARSESKQQADPTVSIYCRLKVNGKAASDFSTKVRCKLSLWQQEVQRIRGRSAEVTQDNIQLERIAADLKAIYNDLLTKNKVCTADRIRQLYLNKGIGEMTLLKTYESFIEVIRPELSSGTLRGWNTRINNLRTFLSYKKLQDVPLDEVSSELVKAYLVHLKKTNGSEQRLKHLQDLKRVIAYGIEKGYVSHSQIDHLKVKKAPPKPRHYLTPADLKLIEECSFLSDRLRKVADFFLIQCYTGMTYGALIKFDRATHVQKGEICDFIVFKRSKSNTYAQVPILPAAKAILERYGWKPPVISLDKTNQALEEISRIVGLNCHITTYTARYTMAMYLLNVAKVRIETVSAILGHTNTSTTQKFYAKLTRKSIEEEMNGLL